MLLSSFWNVVAPVGGVPHSVGLLTLVFLAGAVCSSTGVVFTPYLASHPQSRSFTSAFAAGGGLSGLFVAVLALIADPGAENPRLRIDVYFRFLSAVFVASTLAFMHIRGTIDTPASQYRPLDPRPSPTEAPTPPTATVIPLSTTKPANGPNPIKPRPPHLSSDDLESALPSGSTYGSIPTPTSGNSTSSPQPSPRWPMPPVTMWPVLLVQCLLSSLAYGVVPSILPLACTGYGALPASKVLEWAILGYMIADPVGKIAVSFLCTHMVYLSATLALAFASILLTCAAMSPHPPLHAHNFGALLPVLANIAFSFMLSFTSTSIFLQKVCTTYTGSFSLHSVSNGVAASGTVPSLYIGDFATLHTDPSFPTIIIFLLLIFSMVPVLSMSGAQRQARGLHVVPMVGLHEPDRGLHRRGPHPDPGTSTIVFFIAG
jgi:hypothetical protein